MADTETTTTDEPVDQIDLMIKEDETVLRSIISNTSDDDTLYTDDVPRDKLLSFIGSKVGKVYKDLMMKINIIKMDVYSLHVDFQDFLLRDTDYKEANDLDKLNIKASITDLENYIGTIEDYKNNLN